MPGIRYDTPSAIVVASLALGLLNALRPFLAILTLPLLVASLGLFWFVLNALLLWLVGRLVSGFHVDGFARDRLNLPARLVIPVPKGVHLRDAACAPIAFSTVEHMLFDNAKLQPGETILVQAGGSGIGTVAIKMAKAIGCTVITTVGDDEKAEKAKALGADHVINYRKERFETITRKLTNKKGVDVVFEHVGGEGFNGSLLVLKRGGRLVTCGATAGPTITFNLMQLFQQQYKILGSFGASMRNIRDSLEKMAGGLLPVIDTEIPLSELERGLARLESRQVFGKIVVTF